MSGQLISGVSSCAHCRNLSSIHRGIFPSTRTSHCHQMPNPSGIDYSRLTTEIKGLGVSDSFVRCCVWSQWGYPLIGHFGRAGRHCIAVFPKRDALLLFIVMDYHGWEYTCASSMWLHIKRVSISACPLSWTKLCVSVMCIDTYTSSSFCLQWRDSGNLQGGVIEWRSKFNGSTFNPVRVQPW